MKELVSKIKDIILENNFFDTLAGEKYKELYEIKNIQAAIAFSGRSKMRESFWIDSDSDSSDPIYVTHLYINNAGEVMMHICPEDTDDFHLLLCPSDVPVEDVDDEILEEWVNLLTF